MGGGITAGRAMAEAITIIRGPYTFVLQPGTGDWDAAAKAVAELEGYDFDAVREMREYDLRVAQPAATQPPPPEPER